MQQRQRIVIRQHPSEIPALGIPGFLLLLAALHWRQPTARLLLALSIVPQRIFYDQLPLFLIPNTWKTALLLSISSWLSYFCWFFFPQGQVLWVILGQFFPTLIVCLLPLLDTSHNTSTQA